MEQDLEELSLEKEEWMAKKFQTYCWIRAVPRQGLVSEEKSLEGEAVTIQCVHGDVALYPLADVELEIEGNTVQVQAAISDKLPVSVLLGTDEPVLGKLLQANPSTVTSNGVKEVLVMTRAQTKQLEKEQSEEATKEIECGVNPHSITFQSSVGGSKESSNLIGDKEEQLTKKNEEREEDEVWSSFSDLFIPMRPEKITQSKKEKREARQKYGLERAKDKPKTAKKDVSELIINRTELQRLQESDETLAEVRKASLEGSIRKGKIYLWKDGLLYCKKSNVKSEYPEKEQIILPRSCRKAVLQLAHSVPTAGHLGRKKTIERIVRRFYWPTLYKDVADFCHSCESCQKNTHKRVLKAPMIPMPIMAEPFERMAMDIIGPLPRSRSGCRYVLVMCDYATRYPEAIALKTIDAKTIAEELIKVFARVGIPREILTDQGTNFTSQMLAEVYRLLHVKAIHTTPYHPQTDGLVERFNQTLKEMLRKTAYEEGKDWDKLLPFVLFAYREVPQESTGYSPFELLYGREVCEPLDVIREMWESPQVDDESVLSYMLLMRKRLEEMMSLVQKNVSKAQECQKQWYDKKARQRQFQAGDYVLILLPTSTSKFTAQWQGPYRVVKPVGKVNYLIDLGTQKRQKRIFHVNMLRKWQVPESKGYLMQDAAEDETNDDMLSWKGGSDEEPVLGEQLTTIQKRELIILLKEFKKTL